MSDLLRGLPDAFLAWAGSMAWQAALLVAVVLVLDRLLARAPACVRHGLWMLVAVRLLLPPSVGSPLALLPAGAPEPAPAAASLAPSASPGWPLLVWALGLVVLSVLALRGARTRRRDWRSAEVPVPPALRARVEAAAARVGLRRAPAVLVSAAAPGPLVHGLLRPRLVLPASLLVRGPDEVEHVLLHECAHLARRDLWAEALFALAALVFWWHPLVGLARRRARDVREMACDATVAARLGDATAAYRATLLRLAAEEPPRRAFAGGAALLPHPYGILARLRALEHGAPRVGAWARAAAVLLPLLVGAALLPRARAALTAVDERAAADAHLSTLLAGPHRPACLELRFAVLRCLAAEGRPPADR